MTLPELCEPLFEYICQLNRRARAGVASEIDSVRAEVKVRLADIQEKAKVDFKLAEQAKKVELPLVFFVDSMIATSKLEFAKQWNQNRLARDYNELAGDDRFFEMLDGLLPVAGEDAEERLVIFYTCLGLGFCGSRPAAQVAQYMNNIFPRITRFMQRNAAARYCDEAYKSVDRRVLHEPPSKKIYVVLGLFAFLAVSVLVIYYALFLTASDKLGESLKSIRQPASAQK